MPAPGDLAALVRLPAVLSVPGDVLLGRSLVPTPPGHRAALVASSGLLYLAGMALNDWADRDVDARERPLRPIPSGRVSPAVALGVASSFTAGGVVLAAAAGGRRVLAVTAPLAAMVWAYDLKLKSTAAGPLAMAVCRALDVLAGAGAGHLRAAAPAASVIGAHTLMITNVSRHEVSGGDPDVARRAMAVTAGVAGAAALVAGTQCRRRGAPLWRVGAAAGLLGAYAATLLRSEAAAAREPSPAALQRVVGTGVTGLMPLQAGLLAATGPAAAVGAVAGAWPIARRLAARRPVT